MTSQQEIQDKLAGIKAHLEVLRRDKASAEKEIETVREELKTFGTDPEHLAEFIEQKKKDLDERSSKLLAATELLSKKVVELEQKAEGKS